MLPHSEESIQEFAQKNRALFETISNAMRERPEELLYLVAKATENNLPEQYMPLSEQYANVLEELARSFDYAEHTFNKSCAQMIATHNFAQAISELEVMQAEIVDHAKPNNPKATAKRAAFRYYVYKDLSNENCEQSELISDAEGFMNYRDAQIFAYRYFTGCSIEEAEINAPRMKKRFERSFTVDYLQNDVSGLRLQIRKQAMQTAKLDAKALA